MIRWAHCPNWLKIVSTGANQCKYLVMIDMKIASQRPNYAMRLKLVFTSCFLILWKTQIKSSLKKGLPQKSSLCFIYGLDFEKPNFQEKTVGDW